MFYLIVQISNHLIISQLTIKFATMYSFNEKTLPSAAKKPRIEPQAPVYPQCYPLVGQTLAAERFTYYLGDLLEESSHIRDIVHLGGYYELYSSEWSYEEKLAVIYDVDDQLCICTTVIDVNHSIVSASVPQASADVIRPIRHDMSWLTDFFDAMSRGEEYQSPIEVPSIFKGVQARLLKLFTTDSVGNIPDPTLSASATHSLKAIHEGDMTFIDAFRWVVSNWRNIRSSPLLGHVSNLLSIAIATGFAPDEWSELHINSIKVWKLSAQDKYQDVMSIMDGVLMAINYFIESAMASWEQGNMMPFFYEKTASAALDTMYEEIATLMPAISAGEYPEGFSWSSTFLACERAVRVYKTAVDTAPGGSLQRKIFSDRHLRLRQWNFELCSMRKSGDIVEQAFAAVLCGAPGCGKSSVTLDLQKIRCAQLGTPYDCAQTATIQPGDAYHSQVFNWTKFLIFDDVCNRPLKYDPSLAMASMLQAVNNSQFVAVKAEVELKGTVMPDLKGVFGTTNNRSLHLNLISECPDSLRRRFLLVDMEVLGEYSNAVGGLDNEKFRRNPVYTTYAGNNYKAHQRFTISAGSENCHMVIQRKDPDDPTKSVSLQNLNIAQFYKWMEILMIEHDEEQKEHVRATNTRSFKTCSTCHKVACACPDTTMQDAHQFPEFDRIYVIPEETDSQFQDALTDLDSEEMEYQGALRDAFVTGLSQGLESALYERLGDMWVVGRVAKYLFPGPWAVQLITKQLIQFLSTEDWLQWWYYIPQEQWENWTIFRKMAPLMQDASIRRQIMRWRRVNFFSLCMVGLSMIRCFIYDWSDAWCYMACIFSMLWAFAGFKTAKLRLAAYDVISKRRVDVVQTLAGQNRDDWSPNMKLIYSSAQSALSILGIASFGYFVYSILSPEESSDKKDDKDSEKKDNGKDPKARKDDDKKQDASVAQNKSTPPVQTATALLPENLADQPIEVQNFAGVSEDDLKARDSKINLWEQKVVTAVMGYKNPGMTRDQLIALASKNLSAVHVKNDAGEWKYRTNVLWCESDLCLMTKHDVPSKPTFWKIRDNDKVAADHIVLVSPRDFLTFPGSELCIGHVVHRNKRNLIRYVNTSPGSIQAVFLHKGPDGTLDDPISVRGELIVDKESGVETIAWKWPKETFKGACGGVYISLDATNPGIIGMHYAGLVKHPDIGRSALVSQKQILNALNIFVKRPEILFGGTEPDSWIPTCRGEPLITPDPEPAPGGILEQTKWLLENGHAPEVYQGATAVGKIHQSAFYKTRAVKTLIHDEICAISGDTTEFGGPPFGRSMWPKSAVYAVNPSPGLPSEHMAWAVEDYMSEFEKKFPKYLLKNLRPLTWDETLNGIDKVRFIDAMKWSTSMGKGFKGSKNDWVTVYLDELGHERKQFVDEVWEEVIKSIKVLETGKRVPWLFNGVPKDQPQEVTSDKVRIFMVAMITCTLICRKYFTPICRVLQMMTAKSECAVGINATSKDWDDIWTHLERFKHHFDGDFKKYDSTKAAGTSMCSYKIMIRIAAMGAYTPLDLFVMSTASGELVRPLVIYNLEVVLLDGSTPSGIPVTVIINGLDNSVMNRCAFYACYPQSKIGDFRKYVAHLNYGDDMLNGVSWWRSGFNFLSVQKYLAQYGVTITPGIKTAKGKKFAESLGELVFLQRKTVQLPELPYRVGRLVEASIFKPLKCVLLPKGEYNAQLASVVNVDGALREWVYYGRDHYEKRRSEMRQVLEKHAISHLSMVVDKPYETLLMELQAEQLEELQPTPSDQD